MKKTNGKVKNLIKNQKKIIVLQKKAVNLMKMKRNPLLISMKQN